MDIASYLEILKSLQEATKPSSIPLVVYYLPSELAVERVGPPFTLEEFANTKDLSARLRDIVRAFESVHNHNLVHLDAGADNLVIPWDSAYPDRRFRAVLVDVDPSAILGESDAFSASPLDLGHIPSYGDRDDCRPGSIRIAEIFDPQDTRSKSWGAALC